MVECLTLTTVLFGGLTDDLYWVFDGCGESDVKFIDMVRQGIS